MFKHASEFADPIADPSEVRRSLSLDLVADAARHVKEAYRRSALVGVDQAVFDFLALARNELATLGMAKRSVEEMIRHAEKDLGVIYDWPDEDEEGDEDECECEEEFSTSPVIPEV